MDMNTDFGKVHFIIFLLRTLYFLTEIKLCQIYFYLLLNYRVCLINYWFLRYQFTEMTFISLLSFAEILPRVLETTTTTTT